MQRPSFVLRLGLVLLVLLLAVQPASAKGTGYQTDFVRWSAAGGQFADWTLTGALQTTDGALQLDPATAAQGTDPYGLNGYNGHNYYNGGSFEVGEALSPEIKTGFPVVEAIASWNADTPTGTWVETQVRVQFGTRWSKWYSLGIWAADTSTVERHSVSGQRDADATIWTDTLHMVTKKDVPTALQVKVRLFSADGVATPTVRNMSVTYSTAAPKKAELMPGDQAVWGVELPHVPQCSQMVYPNGGNTWCSPTSTSIDLGYWGDGYQSCSERVNAAVNGTWDWLYAGNGNWPFNTAYAASQTTDTGKKMEGYVARFSSLAQAEPWIKAGVPVVMSIAWGKNQLDGSSVSSTDGHLLVLAGFDSSGNPIVYDPAFASDGAIRVVYNRAQFETLWLQASGGTVYLIFPEGTAIQGF
jgi:hypothetical protein